MLEMQPLHSTTTIITTTHRRLRHHFHHQLRTFINAKVKWVRDEYLDRAVEKEKNLKQVHSIKTLIMSPPSQTLPISKISPLKPQLNLHTTALKFIEEYPLIFRIFQPPKRLSLPHVKLTSAAISVHIDEELILKLSHYRKDLAERLAKLLMLTRAMRLPLYVIDKFKFELGLPNDYLLTLLPEYPDLFRIVNMGFKGLDGEQVFGLELVSWREDLAVSVMEKREKCERRYIKFPINLPRGFALEKKLESWLEEWQNLPYISPYENAFHFAPLSDQAEKWAVAVIHELLCLLISNKTEKENIFCLGEYLGFGMRFKRAVVHHPGIFYLSNKIRTQTVVLREKYVKNLWVEKHPLMMARYQYIRLMNTVMRRGRRIQNFVVRRSPRSASSVKADWVKGGDIRRKREDGDNLKLTVVRRSQRSAFSVKADWEKEGDKRRKREDGDNLNLTFVRRSQRSAFSGKADREKEVDKREDGDSLKLKGGCLRGQIGNLIEKEDEGSADERIFTDGYP